MLLISSLSYTAIFFACRKKAVYKKVCCIYCDNADVIKYGKSSGKQRFDTTGCGKIFLMKNSTMVENQKLREKYLKRQ